MLPPASTAVRLYAYFTPSLAHEGVLVKVPEGDGGDSEPRWGLVKQHGQEHHHAQGIAGEHGGSNSQAVDEVVHVESDQGRQARVRADNRVRVLKLLDQRMVGGGSLLRGRREEATVGLFMDVGGEQLLEEVDDQVSRNDVQGH